MVSPIPSSICTVIRLGCGSTVQVLSPNLGTKLDCSEEVAKEAPVCLFSAVTAERGLCICKNTSRVASKIKNPAGLNGRFYEGQEREHSSLSSLCDCHCKRTLALVL